MSWLSSKLEFDGAGNRSDTLKGRHDLLCCIFLTDYNCNLHPLQPVSPHDSSYGAVIDTGNAHISLISPLAYTWPF